MRVVILAGGMGTRLQEETATRPKPMVEIGGRPLLWHLMKHYAHHGCKEFVVALGYMGDFIKQYFLNRFNLQGNMTFDFARRRVTRKETETEDWVVQLVETGLHTQTGGRLKRLESRLGNETFMLTYGDGLSNVDLQALLQFHRRQGKLATVTAVRPPARFGGLLLDGDLVQEFTEKPLVGEGWINGGFMVLESQVFQYLTDDECSLERVALERLAAERQLAAYRHDDFWQCMDTLRDKRYLEGLWEQGQAAWKSWPDPEEESARARVRFPQARPQVA